MIGLIKIRLNKRYVLEMEACLFVVVDVMHIYKHEDVNVLIGDTGGIFNYSVRFLTN